MQIVTMFHYPAWRTPDPANHHVTPNNGTIQTGVPPRIGWLEPGGGISRNELPSFPNTQSEVRCATSFLSWLYAAAFAQFDLALWECMHKRLGKMSGKMWIKELKRNETKNRALFVTWRTNGTEALIVMAEDENKCLLFRILSTQRTVMACD